MYSSTLALHELLQVLRTVQYICMRIPAQSTGHVHACTSGAVFSALGSSRSPQQLHGSDRAPRIAALQSCVGALKMAIPFFFHPLLYASSSLYLPSTLYMCTAYEVSHGGVLFPIA